MIVKANLGHHISTPPTTLSPSRDPVNQKQSAILAEEKDVFSDPSPPSKIWPRLPGDRVRRRNFENPGHVGKPSVPGKTQSKLSCCLASVVQSWVKIFSKYWAAFSW